MGFFWIRSFFDDFDDFDDDFDDFDDDFVVFLGVIWRRGKGRARARDGLGTVIMRGRLWFVESIFFLWGGKGFRDRLREGGGVCLNDLGIRDGMSCVWALKLMGCYMCENSLMGMVLYVWWWDDILCEHWSWWDVSICVSTEVDGMLYVWALLDGMLLYVWELLDGMIYVWALKLLGSTIYMHTLGAVERFRKWIMWESRDQEISSSEWVHRNHADNNLNLEYFIMKKNQHILIWF
jgi:hypothetical protein